MNYISSNNNSYFKHAGCGGNALIVLLQYINYSLILLNKYYCYPNRHMSCPVT